MAGGSPFMFLDNSNIENKIYMRTLRVGRYRTRQYYYIKRYREKHHPTRVSGGFNVSQNRI